MSTKENQKALLLKIVFFCGVIQRERDYYSKNLSIMNISSYNGLNLFWDFKILYKDMRNYDAIQIINTSIFKIELWS